MSIKLTISKLKMQNPFASPNSLSLTRKAAPQLLYVSWEL